jgi:hypothetical protein
MHDIESKPFSKQLYKKCDSVSKYYISKCFERLLPVITNLNSLKTEMYTNGDLIFHSLDYIKSIIVEIERRLSWTYSRIWMGFDTVHILARKTRNIKYKYYVAINNKLDTFLITTGNIIKYYSEINNIEEKNTVLPYSNNEKHIQRFVNVPIEHWMLYYDNRQTNQLELIQDTASFKLKI